jgi:hypothetical protein
MYLGLARVIGRSFAAALAHLSAVIMPPEPSAKDLGMGLRRPYREKAFSRRRATRQMYNGAD